MGEEWILMDIQDKKAFQAQPHMTGVKCRKLSRSSRKGSRYVKDVGLGYKTPKAAIEGKYIDKKCPFPGNVSIRGKILRGIVASTKMNKTIIVRKNYLHYLKKYNRYEKRHTNIAAHMSPCFRTKVGDIVTTGQCRPLSKTVRFNVLDVESQDTSGLQKKKQFRIF